MSERDEVKQLLMHCRNSTKNTALAFFGPHDPDNPTECHFYQPFDIGHNEIFDLLDNPVWNPAALELGLRQNKTIIAAPRNIGKTTIVSVPFCFRMAAFGLARYIVYIGASQTAAMEQTETLKDELINNPLIRKIFGDVKGDLFAQERWDITFGKGPKGGFSHKVRILPLGPDGKIRGRKHGSKRPDLIVWDDVEFDELVESEDQRTKLSKWWDTAVLNSVNTRESWRVVMIGTILHHDSMIARHLNNDTHPDWHGKKFSICTPDYETLWPNVMTTKQVKAKVEEYRTKGTLSQFSREFMNEPVPDEEQAFKPEYFMRYDETDLKLNNDPRVMTAISIDPARSVAKGSCRSAITGIGVDCETKRIYIRDIVVGLFTPTELYQETFAMARRLEAKAVIIEVTGLLEYITQPFNNLMIEYKTPLHMIEIKPRDKKERRAGGLIPYYRTGMVWHNKACCTKLEDRLQEWPCSFAWDEIDTVSQIIPAMKQEELWFFPEDRQDDDLAYQELLRQDEAELAFTGWQDI